MFSIIIFVFLFHLYSSYTVLSESNPSKITGSDSSASLEEKCNLYNLISDGYYTASVNSYFYNNSTEYGIY